VWLRAGPLSVTSAVFLRQHLMRSKVPVRRCSHQPRLTDNRSRLVVVAHSESTAALPPRRWCRPRLQPKLGLLRTLNRSIRSRLSALQSPPLKARATPTTIALPQLKEARRSTLSQRTMRRTFAVAQIATSSSSSTCLITKLTTTTTPATTELQKALTRRHATSSRWQTTASTPEI
jgi:hypothetical protein